MIGGYIVLGQLCIPKKHAPPQTQDQDHPNSYEVNLTKYWPLTIWPPSYPQLNPLDDAIWMGFGVKVQAIIHPNLVALKAKINQDWDAMYVDFIRKSC